MVTQGFRVLEARHPSQTKRGFGIGAGMEHGAILPRSNETRVWDESRDGTGCHITPLKLTSLQLSDSVYQLVPSTMPVGGCSSASALPSSSGAPAPAGCRGVGGYGVYQATSRNTRDRARANSPPAVATQRTTEREPRRALALSMTPPETLTAAVAVDGLQSAARRSAANGSDDMAAMGES